MATICMSIGAAAALATLVLSLQASAQAASKAPLNIVAAAKQDEPPARTATKKKVAKRSVDKQTASKKSGKYLRAAGTQSVRTARKKSTRRPAERRAAEVEEAAAGAPEGHIMRGGSSASLIARLPWWRGERMQIIQYRSAAAEDQVVAAAEAWLATNGTQAAVVDGNDIRLASADTPDALAVDAFASDISDASEVNALDLAASPPAPSSPSFLHSLLAMLGGALAAAVSARFLFV